LDMSKVIKTVSCPGKHEPLVAITKVSNISHGSVATKTKRPTTIMLID